MRLKLQHLILAIPFAITASCVSINDRTQLVTADDQLVDVYDSGYEEVASCQAVPQSEERSVSGKSLDPDNISLLNWNIYKGDMEGWQQDLEAFSDSHNLMTIQEATLEKPFLDILEDQDFSWTMNAAFEFNDVTAGVMNVSSAESIYDCGYKISEPIIRIPKAVLISYYPVDGIDEKLLVANIHGINFSLGLGSFREQLEQLDEAIAQHDGPMILSGDFNTWSEERMDEVHKLVDRRSLNNIEYRVNNKTHVFGNAIDHVFYRQLHLVSNRVIEVSSSDHNPISVSFRVR